MGTSNEGSSDNLLPAVTLPAQRLWSPLACSQSEISPLIPYIDPNTLGYDTNSSDASHPWTGADQEEGDVWAWSWSDSEMVNVPGEEIQEEQHLVQYGKQSATLSAVFIPHIYIQATGPRNMTSVVRAYTTRSFSH